MPKKEVKLRRIRNKNAAVLIFEWTILIFFFDSKKTKIEPEIIVKKINARILISSYPNPKDADIRGIKATVKRRVRFKILTNTKSF